MAGLLALGALTVDAARQRQAELDRYSEEKQADERVESLQPEDIIRVCGKPFSDTRPISGRRELKYKHAMSTGAKCTFRWTFVLMERVGNSSQTTPCLSCTIM